VEDWRDCQESTWDECLEDASKVQPQQITNNTTNPSICGTVALLVTEPTRWSFREVVSDKRFVSEIAVVQSEC
jgi:hypothetical protein